MVILVTWKTRLFANAFSATRRHSYICRRNLQGRQEGKNNFTWKAGQDAIGFPNTSNYDTRTRPDIILGN